MDQYDPIRVLGEGSFGKVYLMRDKVKRNFVCVKVIKIKNIPKKERDACRMEVELLRRLHHPNIVSYVDSFLNRTKDSLCIVMQYCDGGDLAAQIKAARHRPFSERKILHWFVQIALGMHYMHSNRILHRDLKTQNIFLLGNGRLVLGDLGISKVMDGTMDFAKTCIGTPYYMSPEIFQNKPYNHKSDVWALGCVLYELTTLNHAFDANSLNGLACKIVKGRYPPVDPKYSTHLRDLIAAMLMTNPAQRPDMDDVLRRPFIRKHIYNFLSDIVSRPASNIGDGTMAVRAAAVNAVGAADGHAASVLAENPDVRALKAQLESLNLQSVISKALAPPDSQAAAAPASPAIAKRMAKEQAGALKREQEHKRMVEAALQKLREEREKRSQQRYQPAKESSRSRASAAAPAAAPPVQSGRRAEPQRKPVPQGYGVPSGASNASQARRADVAEARSGISSKKNAVRPVVAPRPDPSEADRRRVEDLDRWEEKQQEFKRDDRPSNAAKEVPAQRQQPSKLQQEIEELRRAKAFLDKRAERRERERQAKLAAEANAGEPRLQRDASDSTAASVPNAQPQQPIRKSHRPHAHSEASSMNDDGESELSARDRVLMQKREREAKAEADRLEALRAAANDNRMRRQQAYKQGRDQYSSQLETGFQSEKPSRYREPDNKGGAGVDARPVVAPEKESSDSLEFQATAKAGSAAPSLANAVAAANDVDAILGDGVDNEPEEWEANVRTDNDDYVEELEHQLEEELMQATMRVEQLQKTLHATKSMMQNPKAPIEAVQEANEEEDDDDDDDEDEEEVEEIEAVSTYNMYGQAAPPAAPAYQDLSDRPSSKGMLGDRIRKLKERCIAGLGLETFQKAYDFLQRLASEDTMVAGYEQDEQDDIKANTLSVLLGRNAHFAPLIEQILFMEETQGVQQRSSSGT